MPYREKVAWLSFIAMAIVFIPYFTLIKLSPSTNNLPNLTQLGFYAATCGVWVLILGIGHAILRGKAPEDAKQGLDERDQAIQYRSGKNAYAVLLTGMILVGCVMPFSATGWEIVNTAIFMIVFAEVVGYLTIIFYYRKQNS